MFGGLFILLGVAWGVLVLIGAAVLTHALRHPPRMTEGTAVARGLPVDPDEAGAKSWVVREVQDGDGIKQEAWDIAGDDATGPVVLVLHGWGDGRVGALQWLGVLRGGASRVWLFDLRGHGDDRRRFTWGPGELRNVGGVLDAVSVFYPGKQRVLFGYSFGAVLAIRMAGDASAGVRGVVADSPYENLRGVVGRVFRNKKLPRWPVVPMAMAWLRLVHGVPTSGSTRRDAERLMCPLLVMQGKEDTMSPWREAHCISEASPHGRCVLFEACDHLEAAVRESEKYAQAVKSLLRGV